MVSLIHQRQHGRHERSRWADLLAAVRREFERWQRVQRIG